MPDTTIKLLKWDINHLKALHAGKAELGKLLGVSIPDGWPQFPEAFTPPKDDREAARLGSEWGGYFFIDAVTNALVGSGGFHGAPDATGDVEIGYEIASEYWNRGYGTQAATALINFAFAHGQVHSASATTLGETNASNNLLQKLGMTFVAEIADDDAGKLWRWQVKRNQALGCGQALDEALMWLA